ncbi:MAG TPA: NAD(P)H-dependent oxidoreductase [Rugosimonospora sp.]|nr:NAD(P)H-dependent oxidoreductase [Rugosimonospora sp.]
MSTVDPIDLVILVGNPRTGSRTRTLAEAVAAALAGTGLAIRDSRTLELADIVGVTFSSEPAYGGGGVPDPHGLVRAARLLIVATPTYKGTYTGLLKVFLDQYGAGALAATVAVPVAVSASPAHQQAVGTALATLLTELGARVPAPAVALLEPDLADTDRVVAGWAARHAGAIAAELATLAAA